jgi:hypothetical protein
VRDAVVAAGAVSALVMVGVGGGDAVGMLVSDRVAVGAAAGADVGSAGVLVDCSVTPVAIGDVCDDVPPGPAQAVPIESTKNMRRKWRTFMVPSVSSSVGRTVHNRGAAFPNR